MSKLKKLLKKKSLFSTWHAIWLGLLLFPLAIGISIEVCNDNVRGAADEALALARNRSQQYDNYIIGKKTHALVTLQEKTRVLSHHKSMQTEEEVQKFIFDENLSGVLIVDKNLRLVLESKASLYEDFWPILVSPRVKTILDHPAKSYMEQLSIHGQIIEYAVTADEATGGLVLCYQNVTDSLMVRNELDPGSIFKNYKFRLDGMVLQTDGKEIISASDDDLLFASLSDSPIPVKEFETSSSDEMVKMDYKGETWQGARARYKDLYLYAFFPESRIYSLAYNVAFLMVALYIVLGLLGMYIRYRSTKANMAHIEEQLRIIQTISRLYLSHVIIDLTNDSWQIVRLPRFLRDLLTPHQSAENMCEYYCRHRVHPAYQEGYREFMDFSTLTERFDKAGENHELNFTFQNKEGLWCLMSLLPKDKNAAGEVTSVMLLVRNVNTIREKELAYQEQLKQAVDEANRANLSKTDFLRRMSHDIRTPINAIRGLVHMSDYFKNDMEKQAEYRKKIMDSSQFLLDLINDVLDMNKLESGTITLEEKPLDLRQTFEKTCTLLEPQIGDMQLTFTKSADLEHPYVLGSALHIRQIFQNILSNAVKYNKEGGSITVSLKEIPKDDRSSVYELTCTDTGIGMDEEFQKKAFEPFSQEASGARTKFSGTGLGLSIVNKLVEIMGGTLALESKKGVGTTFRLSLPLSHTDPITEVRMARGESTKPLDHVHVLLVEDNELNMEIARFLLENEKITVTPAWNGKEAVDIFEKSRPGTFDLILMDVMMPVMNGLDATIEIRSCDHDDAETIPIIAVTANAFSDDIALSKAAGMNDHLSKPIEPEKLFEIIYKYV